MRGERVLTNARIVARTEVFDGTVRVKHGTIADVQTGRTRTAGAIDLSGDLLLPGLVELHTDNLETHILPRPGVHWPPTAALVGHDVQVAGSGITTVLDAICVGLYEDSLVRTPEILEQTMQMLLSRGSHPALRAHHLLHIRLEVAHEQTAELFAELADEPALRLVSLMDHTPGQRQYTDVSKYHQFYADRFKWSESRITEAIRRRLELHAEFAETNRAKLLALLEGKNIAVASHDDTTARHVEEAHAAGITISEFPTTLEAAERAHELGMKVVMGAPNLIKGSSHSGNVSTEELARRGLVDALSSDYVPASLLQGAFVLHERVGMALAEAVAAVSWNPARMAGLNDRGAIEPGYRADLVRVGRIGDTPFAAAVWREGKRIA